MKYQSNFRAGDTGVKSQEDGKCVWGVLSPAAYFESLGEADIS